MVLGKQPTHFNYQLILKPLQMWGKIPMTIETTFCLLKPESYIFRKTEQVKLSLKESGLTIVDHWVIRLKYHDIFGLYQDWFPRITMSLRFYPLFDADLFFLEGNQSIKRMHNLKFKIRNELGGFIVGGYIHAPDSTDEFYKSTKIFSKRRQ